MFVNVKPLASTPISSIPRDRGYERAVENQKSKKIFNKSRGIGSSDFIRSPCMGLSEYIQLLYKGLKKGQISKDKKVIISSKIFGFEDALKTYYSDLGFLVASERACLNEIPPLTKEQKESFDEGSVLFNKQNRENEFRKSYVKHLSGFPAFLSEKNRGQFRSLGISLPSGKGNYDIARSIGGLIIEGCGESVNIEALEAYEGTFVSLYIPCLMDSKIVADVISYCRDNGKFLIVHEQTVAEIEDKFPIYPDLGVYHRQRHSNEIKFREMSGHEDDLLISLDMVGN